jgi:nitroimidazol reductase NimA-like FMN-containing flavoprotein (pyridoxamine 5'-phosphate oxidase superfamily)
MIVGESQCRPKESDVDSAAARRLLREQHYCTIATASPDGAPWVSPVFFNYDDAYRLVWESARDAQHSRLIEVNPRVAVVVAGDASAADEAVYLECRARAVPADGLARALDVFLHGPHQKQESPSRRVEDYGPTARLALYEAVPERVYVLEVGHEEHGYRVDRRREIRIAEGR